MKHLILFSTLLFVAATSYSQTSESAEAEKNLTKAAENLKAKKYQDALVSISKAKEETVKLFGNQLVAALPKTVEGWNQNPPAEYKGMAMPMGQGEISVSRSYTNPSLKKAEPAVDTKAATPGAATPGAAAAAATPMAMPQMPGMMGGGDPSISVTITNNTMWANEVAMAHSNTEGAAGTGYVMPGMEGQKTSAIKVAEYRAVEKYDTNRKSGSVTVIAGAAVIKVDGNNIDSKDILLKIANAIDYKVVKSVLGE